jgi:hypothetical protein
MQFVQVEYKMPESEFVTHVISSLEEYMSKFAELYHSDEMRGKAWSHSLLLDYVKGLAAKEKLKVEKEAKMQHESATKKCFSSRRIKRCRME